MTATRFVTVAERRARLALRHRLVPSRRTDDVSVITRSLVALHSTDPTTANLSVTQRMHNPAVAAVSAALYDERSIVRHHAMRRTLWVFEPAMARAAHASCTAAIAVKEWKGFAAMLEFSEVTTDGASWISAARRRAIEIVGERGTLTARELGAVAPELTAKLHLSVGKPYAASQGAHTRLMPCLGFEGELVRTRPVGGWTSGEYAWTLADAWCAGGVADVALSAAEGGAVLAHAYLAAFGPASTADLQWWAGWSATSAKAALAAIGAVAVLMDDGSGGVVDGWLNADDTAVVVSDEPWCAVLPSLDPAIMGWKARGWYLGELGSFGGPLFDRNGNAGHHIWSSAAGIGGRVVGSWAQRRNGEIATRFLVDVSDRERAAVDLEVRALRDTLGDTRFRPRYPAPIQAELLK